MRMFLLSRRYHPSAMCTLRSYHLWWKGNDTRKRVSFGYLLSVCWTVVQLQTLLHCWAVIWAESCNCCCMVNNFLSAMLYVLQFQTPPHCCDLSSRLKLSFGHTIVKVNRLEFCFMESLHNTDGLEFLRPFSKAAEKTQSCFALDTEQWYWPVTVQSLCRVKKISMTSNVLSYTLPNSS